SVRDLEFDGRLKILRGRMFDPARLHEIVVGNATASIDRLAVGARVTLRFLKPGESPSPFVTASNFDQIPRRILTQPIEMTVVGITFQAGDFGDNAYGHVFFTPAFDRTYGRRIARLPLM